MSSKKKAKRPKRRKPAAARQVSKWEQDPPPLIDIEELQKVGDVSEQTIRNMLKEPNHPRTVGKKFPRETWLHYIQIRKLYGPQTVKKMTPEEVRRAETDNPIPAGGPAGAPTPAPIASEETGNETSAPELIRLNQGDLLKRKTAEELITRRLANQERKRRLIPRAESEEWFWARMGRVSAFKREMCLQLPPLLVGLDRPEIELKISDALDELFRNIIAFCEPMKPPAAAVDAPAPPAPKESPPDEKTK